MKKKNLIISTIFTLLLTCLVIAGCGFIDPTSNNNGNNALGNKFTIVANDNNTELFRFEVEANRFFKIPDDLIPQKTGYVFGGLYEDEGFNSQLIKEDGEGIGTFSINSDIIAYVKWIPKTYTIIYNFANDIKTNSDLSLEIDYDSDLFQFPSGTKEGYELEGWYTKQENGIKIAGEDSIVIDEYKKVNHDTYEIDEETKTINLYSVFVPKYYTVNFYDEKDILFKQEFIQYEDNLYTVSEEKEITKLDDIYVTSWKERNIDGNGQVIEIMPCHDINVMPCTYDKYVTYNTNNKTSIDDKCFHYPVDEIFMLESVYDDQKMKNAGWLYKGERFNGFMKMPNENIVLDVIWDNAVVYYNVNGNVYKQDFHYDEDVSNIEKEEFYTPKGYICGWAKDDGTEYNMVNDKEVLLYPYKYQPYFNMIGKNNEILVKGRGYPGEKVHLEEYETKSPVLDNQTVSWETENGELIRNKIFTIPENQMIINLRGNFQIKGQYIRRDVWRINDKGRIYNPYDTLNFKEIFGLSIRQLEEKGYHSVWFHYTLYLHEIDDGYQKVYLGSDPTTTDSNYYQYYNRFEYGPGFCKKEWGEYESNFNVMLYNLSDIMYFMYTSEGKKADDWENIITIDMSVA